ncbi:MAG TPA: anti-sigma factor [Dehalococcoidia bacterium]|nr:anti-sigma factor [Dehalococcoidia bacterium]
MDDASHTSHPDDLLSLHALHALEPDEAEVVEAHVARCARCQQRLKAELGTAAALAQIVPQEAAPAALRERVMRAVAETSRHSVSKGPSAQPGQSRVRWTRLALPVAASLLAVALGVSLTLQYFNTRRLATLAQENQALAERLSQALAASAQEREAMDRLQAVNYMIADPTTQRMALEPVKNGDSPYHGVLLVSEDGRHATLLVAGMAPPTPPEGYQVWLLRSGKRVVIGEVKVDPTGWGSANLAPQESVFGFDWVALSMGEGTEAAPAAEDMLLRTRITASGSTR